MNPKINRKSNGAFTLVEIIGVMAIIGILGAVVAPRVIDGIREGRVTQLAQNLGQWKSGADRYLQKQQSFNADGQNAAFLPDGTAWIDPKTGAVVGAGVTSFGDIMMAQGLASAINVPFGLQDAATRATLAGASTIGTGAPITATAISGYPQIRCSQETTDANTFTATQTRDVPHRVVYLAIPGVPLQEAAAIKAKIDGPFTTANGGAVPDSNLLADAVAGTSTAGVAVAQREALARGNCRVSASTTPAGTFNLFIYITND
jgi:type II secretory pathway pseudopilin PulG